VIATLLVEPAVRVILLMSVGVFMISHGLNNWLPELLVRYDMSHEQAGYWAAVPTIVGIVASLIIPRLAVPKRRFFILTGLCSALLIATVALQFDVRSILFCGLIFQGIARATIMTVLILSLVELPDVGDRYAGTAAGLFFAAAEFGGMLGPLTIGMLYDFTGDFHAGLAICTCITVGLLIGAGRLREMTRIRAPS